MVAAAESHLNELPADREELGATRLLCRGTEMRFATG